MTRLPPLLLLLALLCVGCDSIQVRYGDATYTRTTLFSDKHIGDVKLSKEGEAIRVEVGKADTASNIDPVEAIGGILEAAK